MKNTGVLGHRSLALISAFLILFTLSTLPASAFADTAAAKTSQLLPPGGNSCAQISVPSFTPFIYNQSIDSFDFVVSDPTYVAIAGQVGNTSIPFKFMTRMVDSTGALHIHVDLPSTPVTSTLPVSITLLSANGQVVCAATVTIDLHGNAVSVTPPIPTTTGGGSVSTGTHTGTTDGTPTSGATNPTPKPTGTTPAGKPSTGTKGETPTTSTSTAGATSTIGGNLQTTLDKICTTDGGSIRLWTVLLAVYLLIIAATILAQPPVTPSAQSATLLAIAIVLPLIVLLSVWYFSPTCRVGSWVPALSLIIAVIGFILGFRNHPRVSQMFSLPK